MLGAAGQNILPKTYELKPTRGVVSGNHIAPPTAFPREATLHHDRAKPFTSNRYHLDFLLAFQRACQVDPLHPSGVDDLLKQCTAPPRD